MLLYWTVGTNSRRYAAIPPDQKLAYISDIGAYEMKPLFIAGAVLTTITLDLSFLAERWLRHRGRLVPYQSLFEKILFGMSIFSALVGTVGLICLSVYDTVNHSSLHNLFLLLFIGGYLLSAIFICWEYQRLRIRNRHYSVLSVSFWIKVTFFVVEFGLAAAFLGTAATKRHRTAAAYLEWIIAFIFTAYVWSFAVDLWPAVRTKSERFSQVGAGTPRDMEETSDGSLQLEAAGRRPANPSPANF